MATLSTKLPKKWIMYMVKCTDDGSPWNESKYIKICSITSVEEAVCVAMCIYKDKLFHRGTFHFFQEGIPLLWDSPFHKEEGSVNIFFNQIEERQSKPTYGIDFQHAVIRMLLFDVAKTEVQNAHIVAFTTTSTVSQIKNIKLKMWLTNYKESLSLNNPFKDYYYNHRVCHSKEYPIHIIPGTDAALLTAHNLRNARPVKGDGKGVNHVKGYGKGDSYVKGFGKGKGFVKSFGKGFAEFDDN